MLTLYGASGSGNCYKVELLRFLGGPDERREELAAMQPHGYAALDVMEAHLAHHDFMAAGAYTIADIGLYAYTHVAHEGGFELDGYPAIGAWLERVREQPGHVPMRAA